MLEYKIVQSPRTGGLSEMVELSVLEGWEPIGGVAYIPASGLLPDMLCQAMIRDSVENFKRSRKRERILQKMSDGVDEALIVAEED